MAARRLTNSPQKVPKFAVIGQYLAETGTHFVKHVAILRSETELYYACPAIPVWHMGPPLVAGDRSVSVVSPDKTACQPHLIGIIELDSDDIEGIETWLAEVDKEKRPSLLDQYVVKPAMCWEPPDGSRLYRRFSCVGFVLECYRSVGINLLNDAEPSSLPESSLEIVVSAYGRPAQSERLREIIGIPGNGPWRIALAGYVFHSLKRLTDDIRSSPYTPASIAEREYSDA